MAQPVWRDSAAPRESAEISVPKAILAVMALRGFRDIWAPWVLPATAARQVPEGIRGQWVLPAPGVKMDALAYGVPWGSRDLRENRGRRVKQALKVPREIWGVQAPRENRVL